MLVAWLLSMSHSTENRSSLSFSPVFMAHSSWAVFSRGCLLPCIGRTAVSDPVKWLWATCGWFFLEVVSSLMESCESQQLLHGDGLHQQHCVRCAATESQASFRYHVGTRGTPWHCPDLHICYITSVRDPQDLMESMCIKCIYPGTQVTLWPQFHNHTSGLELYMLGLYSHIPSVLWHCWLGGRKGIRLVKNWVVRCWCGSPGKRAVKRVYVCVCYTVVYSRILVSSLMLDFDICLPADSYIHSWIHFSACYWRN